MCVCVCVCVCLASFPGLGSTFSLGTSHKMEESAPTLALALPGWRAAVISGMGLLLIFYGVYMLVHVVAIVAA